MHMVLVGIPGYVHLHTAVASFIKVFSLTGFLALRPGVLAVDWSSVYLRLLVCTLSCLVLFFTSVGFEGVFLGFAPAANQYSSL